jgi:hypothetical protein
MFINSGHRAIFIPAVFLLLTVKAFSQELSHQVMLPASSIVTVGNISFSQTVGEFAVTTLSSGDYDLTQGYQQRRMEPEGKDSVVGTGVNAYPLPVSNNLTIELFSEQARDLDVRILNLYGAELYHRNFTFPGSFYYKIEYDVSSFPQGLYLLRVESKDRYLKRTIKIEKL